MSILKTLSTIIDLVGEASEHIIRDAHRTGLLNVMRQASEICHQAVKKEREIEHLARLRQKEIELFDSLIKAISECPPEAKADIIRELITILEKSKTKSVDKP